MAKWTQLVSHQGMLFLLDDQGDLWSVDVERNKCTLFMVGETYLSKEDEND